MRRADGLLWRTGSTARSSAWTNKILQEGLFPKAFRLREEADRLSPSNTGLKWQLILWVSSAARALASWRFCLAVFWTHLLASGSRRKGPDCRPGKLTLGPVDLSGNEAPGEPTLGAPLTLARARARNGAASRAEERR